MLDIERFEQSKDPRLRRFLAVFTEFFEEHGFEYAAFGSCAAFAHQGRATRLTRDLDVVLPPADFERLTETACEAGFDAAREREHFIRIRYDKIFQVHAISPTYRLFDYRTQEYFGTIDTGVLDAPTLVRSFRFVADPEPLELRVVPLETSLSISFLRPINSNSFSDVTGLLSTPQFDPEGMCAFVRRNVFVRTLLLSQFARLRELLQDPAAAAGETPERLRRNLKRAQEALVGLSHLDEDDAKGGASCPD